jgi:hypothetical protein
MPFFHGHSLYSECIAAFLWKREMLMEEEESKTKKMTRDGAKNKHRARHINIAQLA